LFELGLSARAHNCALNHQCRTIGDLARFTERDIRGWKHAGRLTQQEIKTKLAKVGLALGDTAEYERYIADRPIGTYEAQMIQLWVGASKEPLQLSEIVRRLSAS